MSLLVSTGLSRKRVPEDKRQPHLRRSAALSEEEFTRTLCLERRRSERSGKACLLMLLEGGGLFGEGGTGSLREEVARLLLDSTRATDVVGWYKNGATMAVLFTEICDPPSDAIKALLTKVSAALRRRLTAEVAKRIKLSVHLFPDEAPDGSGEPIDLKFYPDIERRTQARKGTLVVKRAVDVLGSLMGLIFLSPLLFAIALAIKLTSKGPVLYRQDRIGQDGRAFRFLKFRSMHVNNDPTIHKEFVRRLIEGSGQRQADGNGVHVFKLTNDPRVTRIGRFIRRTSLDELPQFFNVLKGEMSLVGPRPSLPYELERFDSWHRRRILEAKPGITGLWQVKGRSRVTFDDMVRLDLQYVEQSSLLLDFWILLRTPGAALFGAY